MHEFYNLFLFGLINVIGDFTKRPTGDVPKGERRVPFRHEDNLHPEGKLTFVLDKF